MKLKTIKQFIIGILTLAALVIAGCSNNSSDDSSKDRLTGDTVAGLPPVILYKSESCGCCDLYNKYLEGEDYAVTVNLLDDVAPIKDKYNIPRQVQSCHTLIIGDYFVEGHVPVEAIQKLLAEKPDVKGIALPGMPAGSPGMHGSRAGKFTIYAVGKDGSINEFMKI